MLGVSATFCQRSVSALTTWVRRWDRNPSARRGHRLRGHAATGSGSRSARGRPSLTPGRHRPGNSGLTGLIIKAVEIQAVKRDALAPLDRAIVLAQPTHKIAHLGVPPHPGWKSCKRGRFGRRVLKMTHVMSTRAASGQSASIATRLKPFLTTRSRVIRARIL